jgi:pimeloyl-ACP methyl ester carboxylesterase
MNMEQTLPDQIQDSPPHCAVKSRIERFSRGCLSILGVLLHPLGRFTGALLNHLRTADRLERGLVLVLPGVEGESCINHSIARGLADGGVQLAIEIFDWTTGVILLFLYHLRGRRRNVAQAERLVRRIVEYRRAYPGRPVHLVGHSGGGAITVLTIERLPAHITVTSAVLLQAAIFPRYDLSAALARTELGIWNFRSALDVFFDGIGTSVAGTMDGRHTPATGMVGFRPPAGLNAEGKELYATRLHEVSFHPKMCVAFNFGGHMGSTNRVFVSERIAPLLRGTTG